MRPLISCLFIALLCCLGVAVAEEVATVAGAPDVVQSLADWLSNIIPAKYVVVVWFIATVMGSVGYCGSLVAKSKIGDDSKAAWIFGKIADLASRIGTRLHP